VPVAGEITRRVAPLLGLHPIRLEEAEAYFAAGP
jgi:hypothetical protein